MTVLADGLVEGLSPGGTAPKAATLATFQAIDGQVTVYQDAAWFTANNPVLNAGQRGFESDTLKAKIGDGESVWLALDYEAGSAGPVVEIALQGSVGAVTDDSNVSQLGDTAYTVGVADLEIGLRAATDIVGTEPSAAYLARLPVSARVGQFVNLRRPAEQSGETTIEGGAWPIIVTGTPSGSDGVITMASTTHMEVGNLVEAAGVPGGAVITAIDPGVSITVDETTTASAEVPVTVYVRPYFGAIGGDRTLIFPPVTPGWASVTAAFYVHAAGTTAAPPVWDSGERALLVGGAPHEPYVNTAAAGTVTIDLRAHSYAELTLVDDVTLAFSGQPTGKPVGLTIQVKQDGSGSHALTWPGTTRAANGGTFPVISTAADSVDILTFVIDSAGVPHIGTFGLGWST